MADLVVGRMGMPPGVRRHFKKMTKLEQFAAFLGIDSCQTKVRDFVVILEPETCSLM